MNAYKHSQVVGLGGGAERVEVGLLREGGGLKVDPARPVDGAGHAGGEAGTGNNLAALYQTPNPKAKPPPKRTDQQIASHVEDATVTQKQHPQGSWGALVHVAAWEVLHAEEMVRINARVKGSGRADAGGRTTLSLSFSTSPAGESGFCRNCSVVS